MTKTLSRHQIGIKLDDLPLVFKDAMQVTNETRLRYLWVDSLCIDQDNEEDWKTEAGRMAEVYRNADLVIAAVAASDPSEGCFVERTISPFPALKIPIREVINDTETAKSIWIQEEIPEKMSRNWPLQVRVDFARDIPRPPITPFHALYFEYSIKEDHSKIDLKIGEGDILRFIGYSTIVQIGEEVSKGQDLNDYENANAERLVGFAAPDTDTVSQGNMTILFVAERTWAAVQEERDNRQKRASEPNQGHL
ncbi:unnamed protein product [Fusarium equiseti]|uniref:Heterokaryon incompatibility domain-containing protein n=1 Tax=Fusarium equiseti TaxID=61235 RepID=A0A8J2IQK2_FUSEQ|nr:unnamed protein product [Fusarium equiseti]